MKRISSSVLAVFLSMPPLAGSFVQAQVAAPAAPTASGTVKSIGNGSLLLTAASGDVTVSVPDTVQILLVAPGSHDLKSAKPGMLADVTPGDRALVKGTAGDPANALTATRVIVMKQTAIAQSHAAEEAAWAQGVGGIVKSVDAATGVLQVSSGQKLISVHTVASTVVRRYSGSSVNFSDATLSRLSEVFPGDQIRARGSKSADGTSFTADEIVAGTFHNYSGLITAIDASAGTITLKDLATKKPVTVSITTGSDLRRLPPMLAQRIAAGMKGDAAHPHAAAGQPPAAENAAQGGQAPHGAPTGEGEGGEHMRPREGSGLSGMMQRLPTETLSGLKTGEAVLIVSTQSSADAHTSTAISLLVGVEPILTAPSGESTTLSPWSLGGSSGAESSGGMGTP